MPGTIGSQAIGVNMRTRYRQVNFYQIRCPRSVPTGARPFERYMAARDVLAELCEVRDQFARVVLESTRVIEVMKRQGYGRLHDLALDLRVDRMIVGDCRRCIIRAYRRQLREATCRTSREPCAGSSQSPRLGFPG